MSEHTLITILITIIGLGIRYLSRNGLGQDYSQDDHVVPSEVHRPIPVKPKTQSVTQMVAKSSQTIARYPTDASAYCDRGAAYIKLKRYNEAVADLNKSIELQPAYADAYNNRGIAYYHIDQFEQALNDFTTAIFHVSDEGTYYLNRGMCYKKIDNYVKAGEDFDRAIDLDNGFIEKAHNMNREQKTLSIETVINKDRAIITFINIDILFVKYDQHSYSESMITI